MTGTSPSSQLDDIDEAVLISYSLYSEALCEHCFSSYARNGRTQPCLVGSFEAWYGDLTTQLQFKPVTIVPLSFQTLLIALKKNNLETSDSAVNNNINVWCF